MELQKVGSKGQAVYDNQWRLKEHGYPILIDGLYGRGMSRTVAAFQVSKGLPADGVIGPQTQTLLEGPTEDAVALKRTDVTSAATAVKITPAHIMAILTIESKGSGFIQGKAVILFERHVFYRELKRLGIDPEPYVQKCT